MMCFRDMTFCCSPNCENKCGRKLTKEISEAAERWWNPSGDPAKADKAPIAVSYFCGGMPEGWPYNNETKEEQE